MANRLRMGRLTAVSLGIVLTACSAATESPSLPTTATLSPSPSPEPSATATATTTPTSAPEWEQVASFGMAGGWQWVTDVTGGADGYLAVGKRAELTGDQGWYTAAQYLWASTDGLSWEEVPLPAQLDGSRLRGVEVATTGAYVLYANELDTNRPLVLTSSDGRSGWAEVNSGLADDVFIEKVVRGWRGYVLLEPQSMGNDPALWFSTDGLRWERTKHFSQDVAWVQISDIGAGDDGFVGLGRRIDPSDNSYVRFTVASGDGRTWYEASQPFGVDPQDYSPDACLTAMGPDWLAAVPVRDGSVQFWSSANGLRWRAAAKLDDQNNSGWLPGLFSAGGQLYFSAMSPEIPAWFAQESTPAWVSIDGVSWKRLPLDEGAAVTTGAAWSDGVLLAGISSEAGGSAAFWVDRATLRPVIH